MASPRNGSSYPCLICWVSFQTIPSLQFHLRSHTKPELRSFDFAPHLFGHNVRRMADRVHVKQAHNLSLAGQSGYASNQLSSPSPNRPGGFGNHIVDRNDRLSRSSLIRACRGRDAMADLIRTIFHREPVTPLAHGYRANLAI